MREREYDVCFKGLGTVLEQRKYKNELGFLTILNHPIFLSFVHRTSNRLTSKEQNQRETKQQQQYKNDKPWSHQISNENHLENDFPTRRPASTLANRRISMKHKSCDIQDHLPQKFICYGGLVEIQQLNIQSLLQLKPINIHP